MNRAEERFEERFGAPPAVLADAPARVNLLGEHTDYNDGYVLPTALPYRTTVALRPSDTAESSVFSRDLAASDTFGPGTLPGRQFARYVYGCVEQVRAMGNEVPALDIYIESAIPIGVGLSSSAALEVATLRALRELLCLEVDDVAIARMGQRAEIEYAGVNCGVLDQMASSLLQPGSMMFLDTRSLERELLPLPPDAEILVIDSGVARTLAGSGYNERRAECEVAARLLGLDSLRDASDPDAIERLPEPLRGRARHVLTENARVKQAARAPAEIFGELMNASHTSLREDYAVSTLALDVLVAVMQADEHIYGAKLTGAGFGGACVGLCHSGSARACGERALREFNARGHRGRVLVS